MERRKEPTSENPDVGHPEEQGIVSQPSLSHPTDEGLSVGAPVRSGWGTRCQGFVNGLSVGIVNDHEVISPPSIFHVDSSLFIFGAEDVEDVNIKRDEDESATDFVGPLRRQDKRAGRAFDLGNEYFPSFVVTPAQHESELVDVEVDGTGDVCNEQHRAGKPIGHNC